MRILHVHKSYHERDGAGRYLLGLMRLQQAAGHVVAPFSMHDARNLPTPWDKYFVSNLDTSRARFGMGALRQLGRALWSWEAAWKMSRMVRDFRPDVIHVHNIYTHLSPSLLAVARRHDIPVVMTVHDYALVSANYALWGGRRALSLTSKPGLFRIAYTRFIKRSFVATLALECVFRLHRWLHAYDRAIATYIAPSEFVRDALVRYGYAPEKIVVRAPFTEPPTHVNRYDQGYVLFVGRLEAYKGAAVVIDAMRHFPQTKLLIVGEGPDRSALEARAADMPNVRFAGFLSGRQLWEVYAGARVAVVPSLWPEPFGLVALEAMARSVPVIVARSGGLPEIIEEGESGWSYDAEDMHDLRRCLSLALDGATDMGRMGESARIRAKSIGDPLAYQAFLDEVLTRVVLDDGGGVDN